LNIKTLSYSEQKPIGLSLIVDQSSADPGITGSLVIPVPFDHLTICKPSANTDLVCIKTAQFINDNLQYGEPSDQTLADFMDEFAVVRRRPNDLLTFCQKMQSKVFTWEAVITEVTAHPTKPAYRIAPSVDTPYYDTIFAAFTADNFRLDLARGAAVKITGTFSDQTSVNGAMLKDCRILNVLPSIP
jgi:hypothetical protein